MGFHFSLKGLLLAMAFVAYACAAMVYVTALWANATFSLALVALLTGTVAMCTCPIQTRAFWIGFVIFGWTYFVLAFAPWFGIQRNYLLTQDLIRLIHGQLDPARAARSADPGFTVILENEGRTIRTGPRKIWDVWSGGTWQRSLRVGNALFTVVFAYVGGLVGRWCARPREFQSGSG